MIFFSMIFIIVGALILGFLSYIAIRAFKSKYWTLCNGTILESGTKLHVSGGAGTNERGWSSLHIKMEYEYIVEDVKYISKRVTFSDMVNKPYSSLDNLLNEYIENDHIQMYYNPTNHKDSVLVPGLSIWNFTPMITGFGFVGVGVFMLLRF